MRLITFLIFYLFLGGSLFAQQFRHYDFLGAGHQNEIKVSTSSNQNTAKKTIDGFDIQNQDQLKEASRFLAHATFGADMATIRMTAAMGYEAWLDEQFALPIQTMRKMLYTIPDLLEEDEEEEEDFPPGAFVNRMAWFQYNITAPDLLRQRMAFNWSQIMVINTQSDLFEDLGALSADYYDLMLKNSFGNYRNLLMDVTRSPTMGVFLSHFNNQKANPELNINPDENYAREIMQLFSIGLWELNPDGTRKYDENGQFIPTYDNADIKEFAQVFTGLSDGYVNGQFGLPPDDILSRGNSNLPMKMYEQYHDKSSKILLNGFVIPANQTGDQDLDMTIDHLSEHPNTAPFIAKSLIKFFTSSNPSPAYVQRVAAAFKPMQEDNMQAVLKAILLDPEVRNPVNKEIYTGGKLREPLVRLMNYMKGFQMSSINGLFPFEFACARSKLAQSPLQAPSVFNFFLPDYQAPGPITQRYLTSPEYQILNSTNAIGLINEMDRLSIRRLYLYDCYDEYEEEEEQEEEEDDLTDDPSFFMEYDFFMDYSETRNLAANADALVNHLDILFANGLLTDFTKGVVKNAIQQLDDPNDRVRMATYLILISPDYSILK
ncbi:MAG: DUF1800 family protein [Bacteroidota bacterium]